MAGQSEDGKACPAASSATERSPAITTKQRYEDVQLGQIVYRHTEMDTPLVHPVFSPATRADLRIHEVGSGRVQRLYTVTNTARYAPNRFDQEFQPKPMGHLSELAGTQANRESVMLSLMHRRNNEQW